MKSTDQVGITFVNAVIGRGTWNGVINLQFGSFLFEPTEDDKVSNALVTSCRLRMDKMCAKQLRDVLSDLLVSIEKAEAEAATASAVGIAANGDASRQVDEKLN